MNLKIGQVLGYLGFARFKLKQFSVALTTLERAQSAFGKQVPLEHKAQAYQIEDCIVLCCAALGRRPPFPQIVKFPRTPHAFRPEGSLAVSDDYQVLPTENEMMLQMGDGQTVVTIQEKVDGSNLGFSLSYDGQILVPNRSHYIHSGDHAQFGTLQDYIANHREALLRILDARKKRSTQHGWILYGEWVTARHSIPYHRLPGSFIAFDLFDTSSKRFVSQERLHTVLKDSGIPVCPCLDSRTFRRKTLKADLMQLLESESMFRTDAGKLEGVVLRIEEGDW